MPLIKAHKTPLGEWIILHGLVRPALRRMFGTIWLGGERETLRMLRGQPLAQRRPLIWAGTHPSWWDGYLGWLVNQRLGNRAGYLMMDAEFLPSYRFFTWGGVFGVDRQDPRAAMEAVEYAAELLTGAPNRALWIMPQGILTPPDQRPLRLYGGIAHILRRLPAADVVPVAWRLGFRAEQHPEAFIHVAPPLTFTQATVPPSRVVTEQLTARLTAADDALRAALAADDLTGFRPILRGSKSISRQWVDVQDAIRHRLRRPPRPR